MALKRAVLLGLYLSAESVEGSSLSFECVDDVEGGDRLSLGVFGVGDGVPDHVFQKDLENSSGLFVNQTGNAFDSTSTGKTTNGGFRNSLDVVTKHLSVTFGASLSESLSSFAAA